MSDTPILVWFRRDLRLADNPALHAAAETGRPIIPVFIWAPKEEDPWAPGAASRWWLHHSLTALAQSLEKKGSRLVVLEEGSAAGLRRLMKETGATAIYWNRLYEPAIVARDKEIKSALKQEDIEAKSFNHSLLFEPHQVANKSGKPFQVFTPFWRHCLSLDEPASPLATPRKWTSPKEWPDSVPLDDLKLLPRINWDAGFYDTWTPGEKGAHTAVKQFLDEAVIDYKAKRDFPATVGTSRLSPHLHFGEIGPRQLWYIVQEAIAGSDRKGMVQGGEFYLREVGWREFAHHLLYHFPHTAEAPLRPEFGDFPWRENAEELLAWQRGLTGYPIVDAGMRELWHTGWLHNRVRMIVASFLVKDLLISWQEGAAWFWDTLVDADLASNTLGWQWAGGCGADAAPYFRIFNPTLQGEKFDGDGEYVRHWVPELSEVDASIIHKPWTADQSVGDGYPQPMVDHKQARDRALAALAEIKK